LAQVIEQTNLAFLDPDDQNQVLDALCRQAIALGFLGVCVRPDYVDDCKQRLAGTPVKVVTVVGFPQTRLKLDEEMSSPTVGNASTEAKLAEMEQVLLAGAGEIDIVMNVAQMRQRLQESVPAGGVEEWQALKAMAGERIVKVIIETDLLSDELIAYATQCAVHSGLDIVKTSTGMLEGGRGAQVASIERIQRVLTSMKAPLGIKASGGIRELSQVEALLQAGATRIGTSSGPRILEQALSAHSAAV
jgi:deoxyribose-phosphate aldolase